ncbi:hypothetical protein QQS21_003191 [Conoideocrella luteorostrata]|uniref:Nascent polypeptide-associated complex subunit alpha-like UBA domain-containing protein n=1 Tax=Conoideocrella luteorostrata TaxID=1105319 RepID=A0AAJ0CXS2_9HYPO|nr:hypothetical protein QQS21_003191 [Conoideocrella luteorostrata]
MAEEHNPTVREGAATSHGEDELQIIAKSAEDRKAASALASLDAAGHDETNNKEVDSEAVNQAMKSLGGSKPSASLKSPPAKNVKVDDQDIALVVDQLELTKAKATELLKAHDGDAVKAMKAWVKA